MAVAEHTQTGDDLRIYRNELVANGMSQDQANAYIAPIIAETSARANQQMEDARYASGDLTALEKLQGSVDITYNTSTFGATDALGLTKSYLYQGDGFDAARFSASVARDATIGFITAGAAPLVSAGGAVGDTALAVNYAGRGYIAFQSGTAIGNGAYDVGDGHYLKGSAELLLGGGAGVLSTISGPLVPEGSAPTAPFGFGPGPVEYPGGSVMPGENVPLLRGMSTGPVEVGSAPVDLTAPAEENIGDAVVRFGPHVEGRLPERVASTFRGGSYSQITLGADTTLYRVYGGSAVEVGSFWSRTAPSGPLQSTIDLALNPSWGNTAQNVATIKVPAGTTIYDGFAAPQGGLVGGGSQVYIPKVNAEWLLPSR